MRRSSRTWLLMLAVVALGATGCPDPAADKPDAVVAEPAPAPAEVSGQTFTITDESTIGFVGSKVTGSHDGGFNEFDGSITLVNGNPVGSSVNLNIDATSIWADNERLTGHLKSADFFEVETYPEATFESTDISANPDGGYTVTGNLTLHGVTKSISFPASIEVADDAIKANAEFAIKRFDFGIEFKGKADDLIRDDVVVRFDLKAVPAEG